YQASSRATGRCPNSQITSRPPGLVTRSISARAASGSATLRRPKEIVTASKARSRNGSRSASPAANRTGPGAGPPRRRPPATQAPDARTARAPRQQAKRKRTCKAIRTGRGERARRRPRPGGQVKNPPAGAGRHRRRNEPPPQPVLAERENVVDQVITLS